MLVEQGAPAAEGSEHERRDRGGRRQKVTSVADLRAMLAKHRPGDEVRITFVRDGKRMTVAIKTVADPQDPKRRARRRLGSRQTSTSSCRSRSGSTPAASAGRRPGSRSRSTSLQELGRNVTHGHKIAATGEIALDGTVGPIGGVKQKTLGARNAGMDVFLVPAGENAREARRYADGLRIIPVKSFPQALRALATLR